MNNIIFLNNRNFVLNTKYMFNLNIFFNEIYKSYFLCISFVRTYGKFMFVFSVSCFCGAWKISVKETKAKINAIISILLNFTF